MEILTAAETAVYLRISTKTLARMRDSNYGPPYKKNPGIRGRVTYNKQDLNAWVLSNTVSPIRNIHSFATNDFGVITGRTQDLTGDNVVVGALFDLICEETWDNSDILNEAIVDLRDEQQKDLAIAENVRNTFERKRLDDVVGISDASPNKTPLL